MAAIGNNYAKRNERPSLSDYNKAWASKRRASIQQGQQLRSTTSNAIFGATVQSVQQQTLNTLRGGYSSQPAAMVRVNLLV